MRGRRGKKMLKVASASSSSNSSNSSSNSSNSSSNSNATSSDSSNLVVVWQWQTDDLLWRSFDPLCSSCIEAASASSQPFAEIILDGGLNPTHLVNFQAQSLRQVNLITHRERSVRRQCVNSTSIWEWLYEERNQWQVYDDQLASKFETAWFESTSNQNKPDCPAGVFFELNGQHYCMLFEADATQLNYRTSSRRSVRRCTFLSNPGASIASTTMGQCQSFYTTTISEEEVTMDGSEHFNSSDHQHSYLVCPNPKDGENCSVCLSSLCEDEAVELTKCHHIFHNECITQWFKTRPSCPECLTVYGVIMGTQPPGKMRIRYIPFTCNEAGNGLQGYPGTDIIEITYAFQNGVQSAEHPSPGEYYTGTRRVAYLPKNKEGEEVLGLLKIAWKRRLLFTVGTSVTTGRSNTVIWTGIHHKTNKSGGSSNYGYPDETYFDRVKKELADVNVM